MSLLASILIWLIALLHIYFLVLEMFLWTAPRTRKTFGTSEQFASDTKTLAANQGLYNGFLAAGLIWSQFPIGSPGAARAIATFFLLCVLVAGIYGGITASRRILYVQAGPAALALLALYLT